MIPATPKGETFQQRFCRAHGIPETRYVDAVLRLTLYPHATWLRHFSESDWVAADRRLITGIGRLTAARFVAAEVQDFRDDRANRRFWRRNLRLRVSIRRLARVLSQVWGDSGLPRPPCR